MKKAIRTLTICGTLGAALTAQAAMWSFHAGLSGLEETPPNASPAVGDTHGMYDDVTNILHIDTMVSGMVGTTTAGHIHKAPIGVAGPVIKPLSVSLGGTSTMSHDVFLLSAAEEGDFLGGLYYVNIHSSVFPGGEVRGQLMPTVVPEPASLLALGAGALLLIRRRK